MASVRMAIGTLSSRLTLLSLGLVLLFTQFAQAQAANSPTVRDTYFLNGDYAVFGVPLQGTGENGLATGNILIPPNTVPDTATAVAAFLYWGSVMASSDLSAGLEGAEFKSHDIAPFSTILNPQGTSPCWSSGGGGGGGAGKSFILHRADVLRFFDVFNDPNNPNNPNNGKFILNMSHEVKLPDSGSNGNVVPFTLGASLVIVFRDNRNPTDPLLTPLSSIIISDGGFGLDTGRDVITQTFQGFFPSYEAPQAKLSVIMGAGQANFSERLLFNGSVLTSGIGGINPFKITGTIRHSVPMPSNALSATVTIDHQGSVHLTVCPVVPSY